MDLMVITEEGKLLKKAFEWKAQGTMTNVEIIEKLAVRGLRITRKNFRVFISNPFYAGFVTFLKANNLLDKSVNSGVRKVSRNEQLPLKVFVKEEQSSSPFTGYFKKAIGTIKRERSV